MLGVFLKHVNKPCRFPKEASLDSYLVPARCQHRISPTLVCIPWIEPCTHSRRLNSLFCKHANELSLSTPRPVKARSCFLDIPVNGAKLSQVNYTIILQFGNRTSQSYSFNLWTPSPTVLQTTIKPNPVRPFFYSLFMHYPFYGKQQVTRIGWIVF